MKQHRVSIRLESDRDDGLFLASFVQHEMDMLSLLRVMPVSLEVNHGIFSTGVSMHNHIRVSVNQTGGLIEFSCNCDEVPDKLCEHQLLILTAIARREDLAVFFQPRKRHEKIRKTAVDYGLERVGNPDEYFMVTFQDRTVSVIPRMPGLLRVSGGSLEKMQQELFPEMNNGKQGRPEENQPKKRIIVFRRHKYYHYLQVGIYEALLTRQGTIKNPVTELDPHELAWQTENREYLQFYMAVSRFRNHKEGSLDESDIQALKAIAENRPGCDFFVHQESVSEQVNATSVLPVQLGKFNGEAILLIAQKDSFMELSVKVRLDNQVWALKDFELGFRCFFVTGNRWLLIDHPALLTVLSYFRKQFDPLRIHISGFREYQDRILQKMQDIVRVEYAGVEYGTPGQMKQRRHHQEPEKIIYLSDSGNYVHINPVMCYGEIEIPIRTRRLIYDSDEKGKSFLVRRNDEKESAFTALLIRQHPDFALQLENSLPYFYLHKKYFLDEYWFPDVFETWRDQGIQILGFNELENNKLNSHKAKVQIQVGSGINWFNADIEVKFGKKRAKLKSLQTAVANKRKYVQLDDGTMGMLPAEWLERFRQFFEAGEVSDDDTLHIPWVNFSAVDHYFDREMLEESAYQKLMLFRQKLTDFESIEEVKVPDSFKGTLRDYQQAGLNWLHFLDRFNFGGCLADDMGLGKSAQMIALMLLQKETDDHATNLIVVPTSLLFNWQEEIRKFAPSLKVLSYSGQSRTRHLKSLTGYDVVLASYHTVISDATYLKKIVFGSVILDESQYIKNPETLRYKSVSLLQSRNRFVMTGTPVENHTFDLYSQLSFACPGLLGSKRFFRDLYAAPIDQFKDRQRTMELQQKIKPFVLRRTKDEVAKELPEKTEMVVFCEMQPWQRKIYDVYEKEFREFIDATSGDELRKDPMHVLKGLTQLRQICNAPALLKTGQGGEEQISSKLEILMDKVAETVTEHKILIFSQFVSMLDLIAEQLTKQRTGHVTLTGSTRNRPAVIRNFRENPDVRVFLISLKAGGTGLNLTEADYVFLVDPWWNPAVEAQAIDRVHRIGQDKKVIAVRLICPDTVEEKMLKMQEDKKQLADTLIREDAGGLSSFTKEELLALLR